MSEGRLNDQLDIVVYPARPSGGFDATNTIDVQSSAKAQPVPFDMDGDMKIDLLGLPGSNSGLLRVWQNSWNASASRPQLFDLCDLFGASCGQIVDYIIMQSGSCLSVGAKMSIG